MSTDVQTPFLGTPLAPLKAAAATGRADGRSSGELGRRIEWGGDAQLRMHRRVSSDGSLLAHLQATSFEHAKTDPGMVHLWLRIANRQKGWMDRWLDLWHEQERGQER